MHFYIIKHNEYQTVLQLLYTECKGQLASIVDIILMIENQIIHYTSHFENYTSHFKRNFELQYFTDATESYALNNYLEINILIPVLFFFPEIQIHPNLDVLICTCGRILNGPKGLRTLLQK